MTVSSGSATTQTTGNVFVTTFTGSVSPGTYKVTYSTTVSKDVYTGLQSGGSDWSTKKTCEWVYDGEKHVPGGDTTYEIRKEPNSPPTVNKAATISADVNSDGKLDPGDSVTYNITITGKQLADMGISDSMTDLQVVQGEPTVTVSSGADPAAYNDWINAIKSQITNSADSNYSQYSTTVIGNNDATKIPKVAPFNTDNETTITITYTTKVIDQEAATAAGIYGQQNVTNTFSENWTWQNHTTSYPVKYEDETVTKVSKSVDTSGMQDTKTYNDATSALVDGTNGIFDGIGETTYTIVVGDGATTLDGVRVTDTMSGDQQLILESFQMTGSNVTVGNWKPYAANETPTTWNQQVFDFAFPAGIGTGPVTITYKTRPFTSDQAKVAGIYGKRTFSNTVRTSTDEDIVGVDYEYPYKVPFHVDKTSTPDKDHLPEASTEGYDDTKLEAEETITYALTFGENTDKVAGLSIMDEMTDLMKLKVKNATSGEYEASPVSVTLSSHPNQIVYGKVGNNIIRIGTDGKLSYRKPDGTYADGMPVASNGWSNDGVTWSHFDDSSHNENMVRVFSFAFPTDFYTSDETDSNGNLKNDYKADAAVTDSLVGPVNVSYTTTVITKDEAASAGITGERSLKNAAIANEVRKEIPDSVTFPKNLNHNPDVSKSFSGWDDDGYTTWWDIEVRADDESTYPLEDLTLTEDWASGSVYYTTDWPVQNYKKNDLLDFDLLGATVTTESGTVLQPGRDYTIDKEAGAFKFKKLAEDVSIHIAIHNPDATINTFYQHNQVKLTWKKDAYNTGEKTADATGRRVKQEVDLTKSGTYDPNTHTITWKVIFNPYSKPVVPEWNKIQFVDTLAEG